jgi:hypothetical protein
LKEYVERLARLNREAGIGVMSTRDSFNAEALLTTFKECMRTLEHFGDRNEHRIKKLEELCKTQEKEQNGRVRNLEQLYQETFQDFQGLEDKITLVATKVVYLGDQLESANVRRNRAEEAKDILTYLEEFKEKTGLADIFQEPHRIHQGAAAIVKLNNLANELPPSVEHLEVRKKIAAKYAAIQRECIRQFIAALRIEEIDRMKKFATTLTLFSSGYQDCMKAYVDETLARPSTKVFSSDQDMFTQVELLCDKVYKEATVVFEAPDQVVMQFLHDVFSKIVKNHIKKHLNPSSEDIEDYLQHLHLFYTKTQDLVVKLKKFEPHVDLTSIQKMVKSVIFEEYLQPYPQKETEHLESRCAQLLQEHYDQVGYHKKEKTGKFRIGKRSEATPMQATDEPLVSQDVCTTVIDACKRAVNRCRDLCSGVVLGETLQEIYFTLMDSLCDDHFDEGLDMAILAIPSDGKSPVSSQFFHTVSLVNQHVHLIDAEFNTSIVRAISSPKILRECKGKHFLHISRLEKKINTGSEKALHAMMSWTRHLLSTHQRKTDFKVDDNLDPQATTACVEVVKYVESCYTMLAEYMDGKNAADLVTELGIRFFYLIYNHIMEYQYTTMGNSFLLPHLQPHHGVPVYHHGNRGTTGGPGSL